MRAGPAFCATKSLRSKRQLLLALGNFSSESRNVQDTDDLGSEVSVWFCAAKGMTYGPVYHTFWRALWCAVPLIGIFHARYAILVYICSMVEIQL